MSENTPLPSAQETPADLSFLDVSFRDLGTDGYAALLTLAHPENPTDAVTLERQAAGRLPDEHHSQRGAFQGGVLIGAVQTGVPGMDNHDGWLDLTVTLHPGYRRSALADSLVEYGLEVLRAAGARVGVTRLREGWWETGHLLRRGWAEHDRMWSSVLDLRSVDFAAFADEEARALASGVRVVSLADLTAPASDPWDTQPREHYELIRALLTDVPSAAPVQVWPFEVWRMRMPQRELDPRGVMIAVAPDGTWVGTSQLAQTLPAQPGHLHNGLTGVRREWRGRGLGLALKLAAARAALARGFTHSHTGNHTGNTPMLAINDRLGFTREAATVTLKREV
ncbi:GNAT family N-acetyltransferase [Deinococcus sp.]|uniref:GNAT family N-acetyltransferase n=1 Tax=Deinococcus sp. TaxID=47478 RepID=UPI0025BAB9D8|nr:GNAT family N-acetyltransferase [Deinococcus sp.]